MWPSLAHPGTLASAAIDHGDAHIDLRAVAPSKQGAPIPGRQRSAERCGTLSRERFSPLTHSCRRSCTPVAMQQTDAMCAQNW